MSKRPPLKTKALCWVDVETTGLDAEHNEVIEIAIIRIEPDGQETEYHRKLKMERPENAHPKALKVNGYTEEAWFGAKTQSEVWNEIVRFGFFKDAIVAGQNVRFDTGFITASLNRHVENPPRIDYHLLDTCVLALHYLTQYGISSVSLVPTCEFLGIPTDGAHTALADVRMAIEVNNVLTRAGWLTHLWWKLTAKRRVARMSK